ncbi:MAG TPA: phosphatase PAP2 family protein [Acholeplasmataceae bacterium]|nr:phosphatase PAP2 family protein [Acholeplasmataceae bacterium]
MDLEIVRLIQHLRNPVFDFLFYAITQLGDQLAFIGIALMIYWTIDKKLAHKFVFAFMISALVNTSLKQLFKRVRPFYYQGVSSEEAWRTTGYSFPSGHAQAAGVIGFTALHEAKNRHMRWLSVVGWFFMIMVPLSRIYLGQHFLSDVIVGVLLAYLLAYLSFKLVDLMKDDEHIYTLMLAPLFILALFFTKNHDVYVAAGGFVGFALGYYVEKKYIGFDVKAVWWIQIIKVIIGLCIVFVIKEGLKLIFPDMLIFDFIRYMLIGGWAAIGAPLLFKYGQRYLQKNVS